MRRAPTLLRLRLTVSLRRLRPAPPRASPRCRCGHCKELAPIYEKVGAAFAEDATVSIAKMDATANDVPAGRGFDVKGFPSLYFVAGTTGEATVYSGDRTQADLIKFVNEHKTGGSTEVQEEAGDAADEKRGLDKEEL